MTRPARWTLALTLLAGALAAAPTVRATAIEDLGPVRDFTLTERSGRKIRKADLLGKVWVADFVFTRCTGPCPKVTLTMQRLQEELASVPNFRLVTFTVDPEHDQPEELKRYADAFGADPDRWLFLTGPASYIYDIMEKGFRLPRPIRPSGKSLPEVEHSTRLVLVDEKGHIRGYFDGLPETPPPSASESDAQKQQQQRQAQDDFEINLKRLKRLVNHLAYRPPKYLPQDMPRFNAALNALCALLLIIGYIVMRSRRIQLHGAIMLLALMISAVFLASYLYYHIVIRHGRPTAFQDEAIGAPEWMRRVYIFILGSHTMLAALVAPLAPAVAYLAWKGRIANHRRLARWTWPMWLYVSITGVAVYWMLYRLYPGP